MPGALTLKPAAVDATTFCGASPSRGALSAGRGFDVSCNHPGVLGACGDLDGHRDGEPARRSLEDAGDGHRSRGGHLASASRIQEFVL